MGVWTTLFRKLRGKRSYDQPLLAEHIPAHIAIIMDGNGRWARRRGLPRSAGHHAGMLAMREVIRAADDWGVKVLTLYSFSTENWIRPRQEIDYLWHLVDEFFQLDIEELAERNVHIKIIGDAGKLPAATRATIEKARIRTMDNTGLVVQFALNYGSRSEIVKAVQTVAGEVEKHELRACDITEDAIAAALETAGLPDPDLLIRTAGDQRISNFLLWQIAYTEFVFVDETWPNFSRTHFEESIRMYLTRERRFGGLK